jgi:uncharacterized protein YndB with AHSA1/START domain
MPELTIDTPDDATVVLTAAVARPVEAAYRAFTDIRLLEHWFWPERLQPSYELDVQVGGIWRARSEVIDAGFTAVYGEVVQNQRLAMSWEWDGEDAITKVQIDFASTGDDSTVIVTHGDNPTITARDEHRVGWTDCLGRLLEI